jgi:uncharacterized protein
MSAAVEAPGGLEELEAGLERRIRALGRVVVAFSGGVDSSLVAGLAERALGGRALAVTAASPALASGELEGARSVAHALGVAHEVVRTSELDREGYRRNEPDRCFHCKTELYERLDGLARARGYSVVLSGANADDMGDWRPGLAAAAAHGVVHPLVEAGLGKREVRALAAWMEVPSARKPATPCLASRIPYGTPVDAATLALIDRAEKAVRQLGYRELRVRHYGEEGRVELPAADLARALEPEARTEIAVAVRSAGYMRATLDPEPHRSGSLGDPRRPRPALAPIELGVEKPGELPMSPRSYRGAAPGPAVARGSRAARSSPSSARL